MENDLTCQELVELITDYLEGQLPETTRQQIERHLAGCEGCTNYLQQMQQTMQLTGQLHEEELSPGQRDDLLKLFQDWKKS